MGKYLYTMYSGVNYYDKLSAKENGFKSSSESWMNSKTIVAEKWTEPLMFKLNNKKLTASFMDFNQQLELPEEVKTLNVIQTYYTNKDAEKLTETPFKLWTNYTVYSNEYDVEKYKVEFVDADGTLIKTYLVNKGEQLTEVPLIDTNCYWTDSYLINQPIKCNLKFYKQKINDAPIVSYKPNFELDESNIKAVKLTNYEGFNTFNVRLRNAGFTKTYELSEENLSINLFDRLQEIYPASHLYWITYSEQVFEFQAISEDGKSQWFSFNYEFKKISEELNIDIEKEMSDEWKNAFNQVSDQVVDGFTGYLETIIGVYKYTFEFVNGVVVDYFKVFVDLGQVATDPEKGFFEKLIDGTTGFFNDIGTLFTKGRIGDLSLGDLIKGILTGNASKINYNTTTKVISIIFYCLFGIAVFCVLTWAFKKVKEKNNG